MRDAITNPSPNLIPNRNPNPNPNPSPGPNPNLNPNQCAVEVWAAARGIGSWFGAEDEMLGRAEFKVSTLLSQVTLALTLTLSLSISLSLTLTLTPNP